MNCKKTLLVFWFLAANTKPLKFCKESFYFLLREKKDTGCCQRQMSDSDVRIVFYTSLYRAKKGMGPMKEEQLTILLGSLCSSHKMLQELCLSECSQKKISLPPPTFPHFPLSLDLYWLGMYWFVLLFYSLWHSKTELYFSEKQLINSWTNGVLISVERFKYIVNIVNISLSVSSTFLKRGA